MKASKNNDEIVKLLNDVLTSELTAINQYFLHAEMCQNWGYNRLYKIMRGHSIDEMKHAEKLMERIFYLDGLPNVQRLSKINVGETVPEQFNVDLALEIDAVERLNRGIEACREAGDNGSKTLLEEILVSEEEHIDWLEAQIELLQQLGTPQYLAQQLYDGQ